MKEEDEQRDRCADAISLLSIRSSLLLLLLSV
jgi:hypothetical protein